MLNEHAISYQKEITLKDLDYMIKKANKLGKSNREITHVFQEEDSEGKHIYFSVTGLKAHDE